MERGLSFGRSANEIGYTTRTCPRSKIIDIFLYVNYNGEMGRKKQYVEVVCCKCGKIMERPSFRTREHLRFFCSECRRSILLTCPVCNRQFKKWKSQMINFQTKKPLKKICCSKKCRDIALRVDWNELTRGMLKQRWIKEFGKKNLYCRRCKYDKPYNIVIHHKKYVIDGGSNNPENLESLCLNCHGEEHYGKKDND